MLTFVRAVALLFLLQVAAVAQVPWQLGDPLPGLCRRGESFFLTSAPVGAQIYYCATPNNWVVLGGVSGGGTVTSVTAGPSGSMSCTGTANVLCDNDTAYVANKAGANDWLGPNNFSAGTITIPYGTSDPPTCTVGQLFLRTNTPALKACTATNTWTAI